jgi:hypothetical protein
MAKANPKTDPQHLKSVRERVWRRAVQDWQKSGLSQSQFCRANDLSVHTFRWWRTELARRDRATSGAASGGNGRPSRSAKPARSKAQAKRTATQRAFVPVRLVPSKAGPEVPPIEILLSGGRTIRLKPGFDGETLRKAVEVLEAVAC